MNVVNIVLFIIRDEEVVPAIVCIYNSLTHRIHSLLIDMCECKSEEILSVALKNLFFCVLFLSSVYVEKFIQREMCPYISIQISSQSLICCSR